MNWPPIGGTRDLKLQENADAKTAWLDFAHYKKIVLIVLVTVVAIIFITLLLSPTIRVNGDLVTVGTSTKIVYLGVGLLLMLLMYFIFYFPLFIMLSKKADGSIIAVKRDWFFLKNTYTVTAEQNPLFVARRRKMIGMTFFIGAPIYQPILRYSMDGVYNDINLMFTSAYFAKGIWPRGVVSKQQVTDITGYLGLPLVFEE